jgi:hypothetical protein
VCLTKATDLSERIGFGIHRDSAEVAKTPSPRIKLKSLKSTPLLTCVGSRLGKSRIMRSAGPNELPVFTLHHKEHARLITRAYPFNKLVQEPRGSFTDRVGEVSAAVGIDEVAIFLPTPSAASLCLRVKSLRETGFRRRPLVTVCDSALSP